MKQITNLELSDSLRVIKDTIQEAKKRVYKISFHLIMWGILLMLSSLSHFWLIMYFPTHIKQWLPWLILMPLGFIISFIRGLKAGNEREYNYISNKTGYISLYIGIILMLVGFVYFPHFQRNLPLFTSIMIIITSINIYVTGIMLDYPMLVLLAIVGLTISLINLYLPSHFSLLSMSAIGLFLFLLPGIVLSKKENKNV